MFLYASPVTFGKAVDYCGLAFERLGHANVRIETTDGTVLYIDLWSQVLDTEPHDAEFVFVTHDDQDHHDAATLTAFQFREAAQYYGKMAVALDRNGKRFTDETESSPEETLAQDTAEFAGGRAYYVLDHDVYEVQSLAGPAHRSRPLYSSAAASRKQTRLLR